MRKLSRRKCKVCGEYFVPKFHDIRIRWCCPEHGAILAMEEREKEKVKAAAKRIKERKEKERADRRDLKARKVALKTNPQWRSEAQTAFNRYVRLRDAGKPCISCGRLPEQKFGGTMDCGHYRTRGAAAHLLSIFTIPLPSVSIATGIGTARKRHLNRALLSASVPKKLK